MEKIEKKEEWYNNPSIITSLIIGLILFIIILSQSFAVNSEVSGLKMFNNIVNHNITYMLLLTYFVFLKTKIGRKYFNYINLFLIIYYFITFVTSLFTVFQSFSLATLLMMAIQALLCVYLFHTFLRRTVVWREFKLEGSPFNELTNSWYFYSIVVLEVSLLAVNFITVVDFHGVVLSLLECIFVILFARYIYLYREFLGSKHGNINEGSIDSFKDTVDAAIDKVQEIYKENEIDKKIDEVTDKISKGIDGAIDGVQKFYKEKEIDKKLEEVEKKVSKGIDEAVDKIKEVSKDVSNDIEKDIKKLKKDSQKASSKDSKKGDK